MTRAKQLLTSVQPAQQQTTQDKIHNQSQHQTEQNIQRMIQQKIQQKSQQESQPRSTVEPQPKDHVRTQTKPEGKQEHKHERKRKQQPRQHSLEFPEWGGARAGAGRKRSGPRDNVEHVTRPELASRHPILITVRLESGLESLRKRCNYHVVRDALVAACDRFDVKIVHFAVMTNHLHLVCEAADKGALSRGIKGLCVRIARGLNALWERTGRVVADRYHARALKSPREVRNALAYVLHNARHHGIHFAGPDPCSSGAWFDGWDRSSVVEARREPSPPHHSAKSSFEFSWPRARTWLLAVGWRRHGPIALTSTARQS